MFCGQALHNTPHTLRRRVNLTEIANLTTALTVCHGYGVACLRYIDTNKNFCTMLHGVSSCQEDRLGLSEQPSHRQCRASHPGPKDGLTFHTSVTVFDTLNFRFSSSGKYSAPLKYSSGAQTPGRFGFFSTSCAAIEALIEVQAST